MEYIEALFGTCFMTTPYNLSIYRPGISLSKKVHGPDGQVGYQIMPAYQY